MAWSIRTWWQADRWYFRAFQLLREGRPAEAVRAFDRVIESSPRHARAHLQRALALAAAGRTGEAVQSARRAAELAPGSHAPQLVLGQVQYDAGRWEEARRAFSEAARRDPENRLVKAYLGLALLALGRLEQAAEEMKDNLAYGYEGFEGRLLALAEQYLWQHKEKARPLEEQLTPDEGGRVEARAGLGLHLASAARRAFLWPLARLRGEAAAAFLAAEEAMSVADFAGAAEALQRAEKAGADPERVALGLGQAYLEARKPQAAAEHLARLPEEARGDPEVAWLLGAALFEAGRHEEAREPLAIASRHFTREFVPCYYRGLCEIASGRPASAVEWFVETAVRLNPEVARKRFEEMLRVHAAQVRS